MEIAEAKQRGQRNRRRERAQRMLAQRESIANAKQKFQFQKLQKNQAIHHNEDSQSADDETTNKGLSTCSRPNTRPHRPPRPRKKIQILKEPIFEEDIVDGFAILAFRTYEELESTIRLAGKNNVKRLHTLLLNSEEKPIQQTTQNNNRNNENFVKNNFKHNQYNFILPASAANQSLDAGTSDDSGRASEQRCSVLPRDSQDADSSRDHLSDASSHCSSGKGYICDSEGEDDKNSDAESVLSVATLPPHLDSIKCELPSPKPQIQKTTNVDDCSKSMVISQVLNSVTDGPTSIPISISTHNTSPVAANPTTLSHVSKTSVVSPVHTNSRIVSSSPGLLSKQDSKQEESHLSITELALPNIHVSGSSLSGAGAISTVSLPSGNIANFSQSTTSYSSISSSYPPLYTPYAVLNHSPYIPRSEISNMNTVLSRTENKSLVVSPTAFPKPSANSTICISTNNSRTTSLGPISTTSNNISSLQPMSFSANSKISSNRNNTSPRGHSPNRERESYSSSVSSLSRNSITPLNVPNTSPASTNISCYSKAQSWISAGSATRLSPGSSASNLKSTATQPSVGMHSFSTPIFPPPATHVISNSNPQSSLSSISTPTTNPNPFSAESLFQSKPKMNLSQVPGQADLLRRELDNRFLASQERNTNSSNIISTPYLRTEMHHHQHQHTHVHQHTGPMLPPPPMPPLFAPTINGSDGLIQFKDIPKLGEVDSPFFRRNLSLNNYSSFNNGLLHPGIGPSASFATPSHITTFAPKKTGKWNAMHVRIAWEIYHHQQKQQVDTKSTVGSKADLSRPTGHSYVTGGTGPLSINTPSLQFNTSLRASHTAVPPTAHTVGFLSTSSQFGSGLPQFGRYSSNFATANPNFAAMNNYPPSRDISSFQGLSSVPDPWRGLQRTMYPPTTAVWSLKSEPIPKAFDDRDRDREREREKDFEKIRREREREEREKEKREREKEEKRKQQEASASAEREREKRERDRRELERREIDRERLARQLHNRHASVIARERSPLRNKAASLDTSEIRIKEEPRIKDDEIIMLTRPQHPALATNLTDSRYHHANAHPFLTTRHPHNVQGLPHSMSRGLPVIGNPPIHPPSMQHFTAHPPTVAGVPSATWPTDPFRDPFRQLDPLQRLHYNSLMAAAYRVEEEAKIFSSYPASANTISIRSKDPSHSAINNMQLHHCSGAGISTIPPQSSRQLDPLLHPSDLVKQDDSLQQR